MGGGEAGKAENSQKITSLKLTEGEADKCVASDSDDDQYLNVFNDIKAKAEESGAKKEEVETIGKIHKDINRDFYLRYLDWLMRILHTGNASICSELQAGEFKKILKEDHKIELSESSFNIFLHLLRQYKAAKN